MREIAETMESILSGKLGDDAIEEFLLELRQRGESASEITAAARVMRKHAVKLSKTYEGLVDTCGTGGDAKHTFNVSTVSALVACAGGAKVAKHGNRAVSSVCGSADLLEMLGVKIDLEPAGIERSIEQTGFGFFFAPRFHPATRAVMPARKKIGGKTLFNLLGPLSNPAGARRQLLGVYDPKLVRTLAEVLKNLGSEKALVVHGDDGLDEISPCAATSVVELSEGRLREFKISPKDFGFELAAEDAIRCRTKEDAKAMAESVLSGQKSAGRDAVCLNAGAALYLAGKAGSLADGVRLADQVISQGLGAKKLEEIRRVTA